MRSQNCHGGFDIIAENAITLQAVVSKDRRVTCTQYHPELPYDYIGKLLVHWAPNYTSMFTEECVSESAGGLEEKREGRENPEENRIQKLAGICREGQVALLVQKQELTWIDRMGRIKQEEGPHESEKSLKRRGQTGMSAPPS